MHVCVKMMLKGSKEALTVLIVTHVTQVERVESGVCGFYTTLHTELLNLFLMSKGSKVYSVYSGLSPLPGGKAISAFCLGGLAVHHWSVRGGSTGQSEEAALLSFLDLSTTTVIVGKTHSQSPTLTLTKGVLSNLVILTYL